MKAARVLLLMVAVFTASCKSQLSEAQRPPIDIPVARVSDSKQVADLLHVPSPNWKEQVFYFIMIDRFYDGNPKNSNQRKNEYNPDKESHYSGGDLQGIIDTIGYIKELGATSIWITPPVAGVWYDFSVDYGGYHGYWGEHFKEVDRHFGTLKDYKRLSATLHANGLYLIQDIVTNHTGNFFTYDGFASPTNPERNFVLNKDYVPKWAPRQYPFTEFDVRDPKQKEAAIFHWTPSITDYGDDRQLRFNQIADLDDINTENPLVQDVLRESYNYWIREVGVDGYRIDTVKHIGPEFFNNFFYADDAENPGILDYAAAYEKDDFLAFGEAWYSGGTQCSAAESKKIAEYLGENTQLFPSMLNFTLTDGIRNVFGYALSPKILEDCMHIIQEQFADPNMMLTFIDNHDMPRFLQISQESSLRLALLYLMLAPGIPVIYYGTEQGFTERRGAMFQEGFASGGIDHFDTTHPLYQYSKEIIELRNKHAIMQNGIIESVYADEEAGVLAFTLASFDKSSADQILAVFNTASHTILSEPLVDDSNSTTLETLYSLNGEARIVYTARNNETRAIIPGQSATLFTVKRAPFSDDHGYRGLTFPQFSENMQEALVISKPLLIGGRAEDLESVITVVDGNISEQSLSYVDDGTWEYRLLPEELSIGAHEVFWYSFVPDDSIPPTIVISQPYSFYVDADSSLLASIRDPENDGFGPEKRYILPLHESFGNQMDIRDVSIASAGTTVTIQLTSADEISTVWNPRNGFDHVTFYIYIDLPDSTINKSVLPLQNARAPEGFVWDYMLMAGGWDLKLFSGDSASAQNQGRRIQTNIDAHTNTSTNTISLSFDGKALGGITSLAGTRWYITTWDFDGIPQANRFLDTEPGEYTFGGGDFESDPLIWDDTEILVID